MTLYDFLSKLMDRDKLRLFVDAGSDSNVIFDGKAEEVPIKYLDRLISWIEIGAVYEEEVLWPEIEIMLVD